MGPKLLGIIGGLAALTFILILPTLFQTSPADSVSPISVGPTAEQIAQQRAERRAERRAELRARRALRQTIRARLGERGVKRQAVGQATRTPAAPAPTSPAPAAAAEPDDDGEGD